MAARNCFVGNGLVVKVSDFGLSRDKVVHTMSDKNKPIPWKWSAPEVLLNGKWGTPNKVVYSFHSIVLDDLMNVDTFGTYLIIENKCYEIESKYDYFVLILKSPINVNKLIRDLNEITSTLITLWSTICLYYMKYSIWNRQNKTLEKVL